MNSPSHTENRQLPMDRLQGAEAHQPASPPREKKEEASDKEETSESGEFNQGATPGFSSFTV